MAGESTSPEEFQLTKLSQLDALSSPVRMRILRSATQPITVGELSDKFGVPKTRLYYHVNLLADEGLLIQVDERKVGARIERLYKTVASTMQPGPGLIESIDDPHKAAEATAAVLFDPARAETEAVLTSMFEGETLEGPELGRLQLRLTDEQVEELSSEVGALIEKMKEDQYHSGDEGRWWSFTLSFVPMADD